MRAAPSSSFCPALAIANGTIKGFMHAMHVVTKKKSAARHRCAVG